MTTAQQCQHKSPVDQRARHAAMARFYAEHAARLRAIVARHVHSSDTTVEDACQNAWTILLAHPEIHLDHRGLSWLTTVAIRETWAQARRARELPAGALSSPDADPGELTEPAGAVGDPVDAALTRDEHDRRVSALQALKPREREALWLYGLGHSYHEIAALTDSSYTAVNRRITEGRARLRDVVR